MTGAGAGSKAEGLKVSPADAQQLNQLIGRLKAEGVQVVALLSTQGEKEDLKLAEKVKGLDIIFVGDRPLKDEPLTKVGMSFFLRPSWQGRKLGKLTLKMKDGKLADCLLEEIPLTDKIADAADITAILPACFTDTNCKDKELTGTCRNPGTLNAACEFVQPEKANVTVISMKDCRSCNPEAALDRLRKKLPGLSVTRLDYADADAQKAAKEAGVSTLPAFIFTKQIESVSNFDELKDDLQPAGDFYLLKPKASGIAYFLNRTASPGSFDLFFSIYWDKAALLLTTFKEFNPALHFLATYAGRDFVAGYGTPEVQEYLRAVCVQKYYPKRFWDYLACRAKDIHSSWWEDCLEAQQDPSRIKKCAQGREGVELLKENTALNKELELFSGPSYLLDNQMIFASKGVPERAEFRKILNKKSSK